MNNKVQKAFSYLVDLINGVYEIGLKISEAIADAIIEFDLNKRESRRLRKIYRISVSSGKPRR